MNKLMDILKLEVLNKTLTENTDAEEYSMTQTYLSNYFDNLDKVFLFDNVIYVRKENGDFVFEKRPKVLLMNKVFYDKLPDYVKYNISAWTLKEFWVNFKVTSFLEEGSKEVKNYYNKRTVINKFLSYTFENLQSFFYNENTYFVNFETKRVVVIIVGGESTVFVEKEIFDLIPSLFNLNDSFLAPTFALQNWFLNFYSDTFKEWYFTDVSYSKKEDLYKRAITGKFNGLVKDNLKK